MKQPNRAVSSDMEEHLTFNRGVVKEHPIIINTSLIPATLEGRKTQTRRTRGLQALLKYPDEWTLLKPTENNPLTWHFRHTSGIVVSIKCPYGQVGDRLWVKETVKIMDFGDDHKGVVAYKTTINPQPETEDVKWTPSIFMPRWASRINLEITGVRVERLQEITWQDIWAEGCPTKNMTNVYFRDLWDSLNAKRGYGWDTNCWVWVISFIPLMEVT